MAKSPSVELADLVFLRGREVGRGAPAVVLARRHIGARFRHDGSLALLGGRTGSNQSEAGDGERCGGKSGAPHGSLLSLAGHRVRRGDNLELPWTGRYAVPPT